MLIQQVHTLLGHQHLSGLDPFKRLGKLAAKIRRLRLRGRRLL